MRFLALAFVAALLPLSGCLADDGDDDDGAYGPGSEAYTPGFGDLEELEGREEQRLGGREVFTPGPAGSFGFTVTVPKGGAVNVQWHLDVTGSNVDSYVEGPACERDAGQVGNVQVGASSTTSGTCDDLPEGSYEFTIVHTAGAVDLQAEVLGFVGADD